MHRDCHSRFVVPAAVIVGLMGSALLALVTGEPVDGLPGVALGSELILIVERVVLLFAAWMAILIVVVRALGGELPTEISGQGIKYADAEATERAVARTETALDGLRRELEKLRKDEPD